MSKYNHNRTNERTNTLDFESKLHSPSHFNKDMRDSSIDNYLEIALKGAKTRQEKIIKVFKFYNNMMMSREMIAKVIGRKVSLVTQAVKDLVRAEVLVESNKRLACEITGNRVYYLRLSKEYLKENDLI